MKQNSSKYTLHNITDFLFRISLKFTIRYLDFEVVIKLNYFQSKEVYHHIIAPEPFFIGKIWNIKNILPFYLGHLLEQLIVEDTGNNVDVDDGHIDRHADNVHHIYTYTHVDVRTWSYVVIRVTIEGRNVHTCTA